MRLGSGIRRVLLEARKRPRWVFLFCLVLASGLAALIDYVNRDRLTVAQTYAIDAAKSELRRIGGFQDGSEYQARNASAYNDRAELVDQAGWHVFVKFPGNYVGGHCVVVLDRNFNVVRVSGGR